MRLQRKQEEELARRKGNAGKTIIQFVWLLISFVLAYFLANYLFNSEVITEEAIVDTLLDLISLVGGSVSAASIPGWLVLGVVMLVIVFFMQLFLFIGFALASPEGRQRTGDPSLRTRHPQDFDDRGYG
jgi:hypothetical protein